MCQVNTDPMIWQTAVLDVRVPPDVDVKRSSPDVEVKAGANAKLECYAHGVPPPTVSWQREDKKPIKAKDPITGLIHTCKPNLIRNKNSTKKRASRASALCADGLHLRVDF